MEEHTDPTQSRVAVSQGLHGVREAARRDKGLKFTALLHHVNERLLLDSFHLLKKEAAPGVDDMTWKEYEQGVEERIADLHGRVHRGAYRVQPSRRVYIPKPDGRQRPLGIAALEDKIVQQAVVTVLNQIYEEDFLGFSYGFRPGRGAHDALDALTAAIMTKKVSWILDADIRGFFDNISHERLIELLEVRIADRRIIRLIQKWLKAGVSEDGQWSETKTGTPDHRRRSMVSLVLDKVCIASSPLARAVISPLLANIYLHYVLDRWAMEWRRKNASGDMIIVRYADDFVLGFQHRKEAERFPEQLRKRLADYGLELHSDKTRLIQFGRFAAEDRKREGREKPETFGFLGFTHICGTIHKSGKFTVHRKTVGKRMTAKLRSVGVELRRRMHKPIAETGDWLKQVVRGYFNYHAVPGNLPRLETFRQQIARHWRFTLRRRVSATGGHGSGSRFS
jgi:RNA-directed DNA polymerase